VLSEELLIFMKKLQDLRQHIHKYFRCWTSCKFNNRIPILVLCV